MNATGRERFSAPSPTSIVLSVRSSLPMLMHTALPWAITGSCAIGAACEQTASHSGRSAILTHMARMRVGVLRGGNSPLYSLSLKTGGAVLQALSPERYEVRDILIDTSGKWHVRGLPVHPARAL